MLYLDSAPLIPDIVNGSRLESVYWICTQACNLRCTYCYQDATVARPDELSTIEAEELIRQAVETGATTFVFTGGEPFVRRDLLHLARYCRDCGIRANVITNGHYITPNNIGEIAEIFSNVTISLDGGIHSHDHNRGHGSWARAVQSIQLLIKAGVPVDINSVLSRVGLSDIDQLLQLVHEWKVGEHRIVPQFPMGRGAIARDGELSDEELLRLDDYLYAAQRKFKQEGTSYSAEGSYSTEGMRRNHCGAGLSEVSVDPEGWVYPCRLLQYTEFRTGNIREQRLTDIVSAHPTLLGVRSRTADRLQPCSTCIIRNHCGGGCRGMHYSFTGDYSKANPLFCAYLRHVFEVEAWSGTGEVPHARKVNFKRSARAAIPNFVPISDLTSIAPQC